MKWRLPGILLAVGFGLLGGPWGRAGEAGPKEPTHGGKTVRQWLAELKSEDLYARHKAARALGALGPRAREAIPALAAALKDPERHVRTSAARALGQTVPATRGALAALLAALKDPESDVREAAGWSLRQRGLAPPEAVPDLLAACRDRDAAVREAACACLGRMGAATPGSVPALGAALKDPDPAIRDAAYQVLRNMGQAARAFVPVRVATLVKVSGPWWFSPDGKTLVTGAGERPAADRAPPGVRLWDVATWKEKAVLRDAFPLGLFSPDGKVLALYATGPGGMKGLRLWDAAGWKEGGFIKDAFPAGGLFSPDGKLLAVAVRRGVPRGKDGVLVWDVAAGKTLVRLSGDLRRIGTPLYFSKDGKTLATFVLGEPLDRRGPQHVVVWDVATGRAVASTRGRDLPSLAVVSTRAGLRRLPRERQGLDNILAGKTRVEPLATGMSLFDISVFGKAPGLNACAPDGRFRATVPVRLSFGSLPAPEITLVSNRDPGKRKVLRGYPQAIFWITFSTDGKRIAAGNDLQVSVWDVSTGEEIAALPQENAWGPFEVPGGSGPVLSEVVALRGDGNPEYFTPDGQALVVAGPRRLEVWGLPPGPGAKDAK
jgi:WD40 repeat protein